MSKQRDVYVAIARAAKRGKGLRLTAEEAAILIGDEAIISAAENCETECVCDVMRFHVVCEFCRRKRGDL